MSAPTGRGSEALSDSLKSLPSVDQIWLRLQERVSGWPRRLVLDEIRRELQETRVALRSRGVVPESALLEHRIIDRLEQVSRPSLRRVINATGVVLHTNLGRAPLPALPSNEGYSNLEYNLRAGKRGKRDVHVSPLLERLLGASAIAVNNNAAAVYLALHELAAGGEVIVSRGELIEIGDGFRIPDIMARSGALLREVGTTNRTRLEDYRSAVSANTRLIMRVHPSNFRIEGFTGRPSLQELASLCREHNVPLYEDLGSGCLTDLSDIGIEEPRPQTSLLRGANLVSFSTDKLMGGPQAGVLAGSRDLVGRLRRNPMFRALRLDKLIYAALETTLRHVLLEEWDKIPALSMIRMPAAQIRERALALQTKMPWLESEVIEGLSVIGGGSTPEQPLPTYLLALRVPDVSRFEQRLRNGEPPVIARIQHDRLLLDLRSVLLDEEDLLVSALRVAVHESR